MLAGQDYPGAPQYPRPPEGYTGEITPDTPTALTRGWYGRNTFRLLDAKSGATALQFDAVLATRRGSRRGRRLRRRSTGCMTNIFIVSIATGKADFVARARYGRGPNWPLSANANYVMWTDNFCWMEGVDPPQGNMQLYDRATKSLTDIEGGFVSGEWVDRFVRITSGGSIGIGSFGPFGLVDATSLTWTTVASRLGTNVSGPSVRWSADDRYGSYAPTGGHGGLC